MVNKKIKSKDVTQIHLSKWRKQARVSVSRSINGRRLKQNYKHQKQKMRELYNDFKCQEREFLIKSVIEFQNL